MSHLDILVLGCTGGPFETNLSSYVLLDTEKHEGLLLDGGSILCGLQKVFERGHLHPYDKETSDYVSPLYFLRKYIKAVLISHVHLDHILGLILVSQSDSFKPIYASDEMICHLRDHIFNGKIWTNMTNEGFLPNGLYHFRRLPLQQKMPIEKTSMHVEAFPLNHAESLSSTAFLVECRDQFILYFGDTSSDLVEKERRNELIWQKAAPLVKEGKLKALFIECSYPNSQKRLFGHLNPDLLLSELNQLQKMAQVPLQNLKVIVTHRKQNIFLKEDRFKQIEKELLENNHLGVNFIFPTQGDRIAV